ncbi:hypothetical protein BDEG_22991 [Batrachochytrium dendrobatidis JEL423]|uniref:NADP-dependent oxidoreductase domain-containing protein n=1 Tax=Batrachochytrium dendrobatidis (strain JEL423) TaxID=403673 RepID=A0A177WG72_BATDL|nr:hypothetical protein BDEG_22991 [Batrachochytrium dendrobatidis JEL423]
MIQSGIVCRKKLFITSKIGPKSQGYEKACESIKNSLDRFGSDVGYIDLMLIHWPGSQGMKPEDPQHKINRAGTWRAMEEAYKAGSIRAIGVSNYTVKHIQEFTTMMHENKCTDPDDVLTMPMINQFELHPLLWNDTTQKLIETCHNLDCRVAGYSCFGSGLLIDGSAIGNNGLTLADFSTKIGATVSQVLIKWAITRGDIVMPKARSEAHLLENLNAAYLELSDEDLKWIDSLAQISGIKRFCWDPTNICNLHILDPTFTWTEIQPWLPRSVEMSSFVKKQLKTAREALAAENYEYAETTCADILENDSTNYNALVFRGLALLQLGRTDESLASYNAAISAAPSQALAYQTMLEYLLRILDRNRLLESTFSILASDTTSVI